MISSPLIISACGGSVASVGINEESLVASKTLTSEDALYQDFIINIPNLTVSLPGSPTKGDRFIIKNDFDSTEDLIIEPGTLILIPGAIVHVVYGETKWIEF